MDHNARALFLLRNPISPPVALVTSMVSGISLSSYSGEVVDPGLQIWTHMLDRLNFLSEALS